MSDAALQNLGRRLRSFWSGKLAGRKDSFYKDGWVDGWMDVKQEEKIDEWYCESKRRGG